MAFNKKPEVETSDVEKTEIKPEDKKKEVHRVIVVKQEELPIQVVREVTGEDGVIRHYMSIEEALTELMNK